MHATRMIEHVLCFFCTTRCKNAAYILSFTIVCVNYVVQLITRCKKNEAYTFVLLVDINSISAVCMYVCALLVLDERT